MSTQKVAGFVAGTIYADLPPAVVAKVKDAIRDHIGVMLAAHPDEAVAAARKFAVGMGGAADSTLIGTPYKVPCNLAALVGAVMARTLDMDDGAYRPFGHLAHAGGVVVPACLAVAEREQANGKQLIEAAAVGYEVDLRAGWLIALWKMFAPAGMAGTYGAAALSAKLLGFDTAQTADCLGVAEAHCLWPSKAKRFADTAMTKEAAGWGAMTGVSAALLVRAGFNGPDTLFDLKEVNAAPLETLGQEWEVMNLYFKPYSSCRATHTPLDGVFQLVKQHQLTAADVVRVNVGVPSFLADAMATYRPVNIWQAQFSIPYVIGAALADGEVSPPQFTPNKIADAALLAQADKVKLVADDEVYELAVQRGLRAARVSISTRDGSEHTTLVEYARGAPENPLSANELTEKFIRLATGALGTDKAKRLNEIIGNLEDLDNTTRLIDEIGVI